MRFSGFPFVIAAALLVVGCQAGSKKSGGNLFDAGSYADAENAYKQELIDQKRTFGSDHAVVAATLNNLAQLYDTQGRYGEAENYHKQALAIREKNNGPESPVVAQSVASLASLYDKQGRHDEAAPLHDRALTIREAALGPGHPAVADSLDALARHFSDQGRYDEAEPLQRRSLKIIENAPEPDDAEIATSLNNLAQLLIKQGRYQEVEALHSRALAIRKKAFGTEHPVYAQSLASLAFLLDDQGRYSEAESLHRQALEVWEKSLGFDHPNVAASLNNLAYVFVNQGRYGEAEPFFLRALDIWEKSFGPDHPNVAGGLNNLAWVDERQGRYEMAERRHKRALKIRLQSLGPDHPDVAGSYNNLAKLYASQGRFDDAGPLYEKSLAIRSQVFGPDHPLVASTLLSMAQQQAERGRPADAKPLNAKALAIYEGAFGGNHPNVAKSLNALAAVNLELGELDQGLDNIRRATAIYQQRSLSGSGNKTTGTQEERRNVSHIFQQHVKIASAAMIDNPQLKKTLLPESFNVSQLAHSNVTGAAMSNMAARFTTGNDELALIVRDHQDTLDKWRNQNDTLVDVANKPANKRDRQFEARLKETIGLLGEKLDALNGVLNERFPEYAELSSPRPISLSEISALLGPDEALMTYLASAKSTFLWVVRKDRADIFNLDISRQQLDEEVAALRKGLDPTGLTSLANIPTFDTVAASNLYQNTLAPAEEILAGVRHLFIVPDGALQSLPFGVLVTGAPQSAPTDFTGYRDVAWLADKYAMTTLPSVSSLRALRLFAKVASAQKPFGGIGDPLLKGHPSESRGVQMASMFTSRGIADVEAVRTKLAPLPDTADELEAMAKILGGNESDIFLRERATETMVKALPLSDYKVLAFATHGLVAGDLKGLAEPALVLTPPQTGTLQDDGLLTASEVATLKLNADLVVLSACNTASADGSPNADALSGLAKAFFYAGSRSMLVSHWPVGSDAAVNLTTKMLKEVAGASDVGRAEGLRRSMLSLMQTPDKPYYAHPMFWAPFVVVGEGGVYGGS